MNTEANQWRYTNYNRHYACFSCRKMFNQMALRRTEKLDKVKCPQCKVEMHNMGKDFKPPRKENVQQWRKVELLARRGYRWQQTHDSVPVDDKLPEGWHRYITVGGGPRAKTLREAKADYPALKR